MDRQTFTDPTVAKIMNTYYYPVKFNAEGNETVTWNGRVYPPATQGRNKVHVFTQATLGQRIGFPSFAIFRADGTLLTVVPGFYPPKEFAVILWYFASGDNAKYPYDKYMQIFDKEIYPVMEKALK
jgi:thioredoxin-related protein